MAQIGSADLVGVWRLAELASSDGTTVSHPLGPDPRGMLVYLESGQMSVHFSAADGHTGAQGYCGRWELRGDEVLHRVEIDRRAERPGAVLTRRVELRGDEIVLTKPPEGGRTETVRWRRAGA